MTPSRVQEVEQVAPEEEQLISTAMKSRMTTMVKGPNKFLTLIGHSKYWKYKMMIYLESMGPKILWIVEKGFTYENEDDPTPTDDVNAHRNAQAVSKIISTLSSSKYNKVMSIKMLIPFGRSLRYHMKVRMWSRKQEKIC